MRMKFFRLIGEYLILMRKVFRRPEKRSIFFSQLIFLSAGKCQDDPGYFCFVSFFRLQNNNDEKSWLTNERVSVEANENRP